MWSMEVLNYYPATLNYYPEDWVAILDDLSDEDLWKIDSKIDFRSISGTTLHNFLTEINELSQLNFEELEVKEFPHWAYVGVKYKKKHELDTFAALITSLHEKHHYDSLVNIGGGMGHLSRIVAHYQLIDCCDVDMNKELQDQGEKRLGKYPLPDGARPVSFIHQEIGKNTDLSQHFKKDGLTTGLHTCGVLAVRHLEMAIKSKVKTVINFGCCYAKSVCDTDFELSSCSKDFPLKLTNHALTLGTRSHTSISYDDFVHKTKVKRFRYTLHLLCKEKLKIDRFITVGNGTKAHYKGNFSNYVMDMLDRVGIKHNLSLDELDAYYNDPDIVKIVRKMYLMNIIRWQLGRLIELYILTDRALYLQDNGYDVRMAQVFNEEISPRNIAVIGVRN